MIDRRSFLRRVFSAVAAGAVLDVDQLLWVLGAKTIWLPPVVPVQPYALISPAWLTREVLELLKMQLAFIEQTDRLYEARRRFEADAVVSVRMPTRPRPPMRGHRV
jgi:hypothetical protein